MNPTTTMSKRNRPAVALALVLAVGAAQAQTQPIIQTQTLAEVHAEFLKRPEFTEDCRQALRECAKDIQAALARSSLPKNQPLAILPVTRDNNYYIIGLLKNSATGAGLTCVEGKEDPMIVELFRELGEDIRKSDVQDPKSTVGIFNPEKLDQFGHLLGAQMLMYAYLRDLSGGDGRGYAELEVHVTSIPTKKHLWGQTFARRFYSSPKVVGHIDIGPEVRAMLKASFDDVPAKLRASQKLKGVRNVAFIPLAGDQDGYITGLAQQALSESQLYPKDINLSTRSEAQAMLRDNQQVADALLFGAVRDFHMRKRNNYPDREVFDLISSIQLTLQSGKSGEVLWSDTIEGRGEYVKGKSWWEMLLQYGPVALFHKWYILIPLLVLLGLVVLAMFFRTMRRAR